MVGCVRLQELLEVRNVAIKGARRAQNAVGELQRLLQTRVAVLPQTKLQAFLAAWRAYCSNAGLYAEWAARDTAAEPRAPNARRSRWFTAWW